MFQRIVFPFLAAAVLVSSVAAAANGNVSWITDESTRLFLREIGFPIFIALGMFGLFGWFLKRVTDRFFKQMDTSQARADKVSDKLVTVLETTLSDTRISVVKMTEAVEHVGGAVAAFAETNVAEHKGISDSLNRHNERMGRLLGTIERNHVIVMAALDKAGVTTPSDDSVATFEKKIAGKKS